MGDIESVLKRVREGGPKKYHEKLKETKKLFARDRIALLCDEESFVEEGSLANCHEPELAADGVVTGLGRIEGRPVALMANDFTVKAGSWGRRTVEKILRLQETAERLQVPVFYLVDSAGARITDQVEMFPGRRGAGRIFYNESRFSGKIPQICILFGPSAAGGAYIPAFCDVVFMVEGNASMYLGSPRMAESVIGEKVSLEEMGGARMHCTQSGVGDFLMPSEEEAIARARHYLTFMPQNYRSSTAISKAMAPELGGKELEKILPETDAKAYDMKRVVQCIVDKGSFFEIKELYAREILTGFARLDGKAIGIVANQPMVKGGVLFGESANKAARFMQICNAYHIPLLFLADVPGFMIGSKVEKEGIIRAGAKMIHALSNARVPKISLIVRKAFGAGLYAMCGPAFGSDVVLGLPTAQIAVMGPEPAVNAVYYNKIAELEGDARKKFVAEKIAEYKKDVDLLRLADELVVDELIEFERVRSELIKRFAFLEAKDTRDEGPPVILPM